MRINNNLSALNTYSKLNSANNMKSSSLEKLSSGLRINRASDDAAGLAISEKMRGQISGLNQASRNAQDGISLIQTAEGALNETHSILQRMRELSVQASNGTLSGDDKKNIELEVDQLTDEIDRIAGKTRFNGVELLNGKLGVQLGTSGIVEGSNGVTNIDISGAEADTTFTIAAHGSIANGITLDDGNGNEQTVTLADNNAGVLDFDKLGVKISVNDTWTVAGLAAADSDGAGAAVAGTIVTSAASGDVSLQIGEKKNDTMAITIGNMTSAALGVDKTAIDIVDGADDAIGLIDTAINTVSEQRAKLGARQNRLEHTISNLATSAENITAAESRIRDVDMAKEMMEFTKNNILSQAATSMLAQANQSTQGVLQLLR